MECVLARTAYNGLRDGFPKQRLNMEPSFGCHSRCKPLEKVKSQHAAIMSKPHSLQCRVNGHSPWTRSPQSVSESVFSRKNNLKTGRFAFTLRVFSGIESFGIIAAKSALR